MASCGLVGLVVMLPVGFERFGDRDSVVLITTNWCCPSKNHFLPIVNISSLYLKIMERNSYPLQQKHENELIYLAVDKTL